MFMMKPLCRILFALGGCISVIAYADSNLQSMTDEQLSETTGQALMSLSYIAPADTSNLMTKYSTDKNIGFYKLGLEAEMDLNANIKNLQLGCGGTNGAGACDVDIKNLSLSGLPANYDPNSADSPNFGSATRASTSAKLTNPFMEFAVKNPNTSSTREIVGLRFSAEKITGLLSAGLDNGTKPTTNDGIQSLSGFMRVASTTGSVNTQGGKFGLTPDQSIGGNIEIALLGGLISLFPRYVQSYPNAQNPSLGDRSMGYSTGITIPEMKNVGFTLPGFQINGNRMNKAQVDDIMITLPNIPVARPNGCSSSDPNYCNQWNADQLVLNLRDSNNHTRENCISIILASACNAKFIMGQGSAITNLNLNVSFKQSLSMFHNIPLSGTGGYLSLQQMALLWPGSYVDAADSVGKVLSQMSSTDVAQKGWWMSFADPVQLGKLKGGQDVDISTVLPQVAALVTQDLSANTIKLSLGEGLGALANTPVTKTININLDSYTRANPARLTLENLQLANQGITPNCYGSLRFC